MSGYETYGTLGALYTATEQFTQYESSAAVFASVDRSPCGDAATTLRVVKRNMSE